MSDLSWESPGVILRLAEDVVTKHSPYRASEEWALTRRHHGLWCEPVIYVLQGLPAGSIVLDVGPGHGALAAAATLLGHRVYAVERFLQFLPEGGGLWRRGDICAPGVVDGLAGQCDVVLMMEVLEHLTTDPTAALRNVATALRPGGVFIGSTPEPDVWPGREARSGELPAWSASEVAEDRHVRLYSPAEVAALLSEAGLEMLSFEGIGAPPARFLWWARKAGVT